MNTMRQLWVLTLLAASAAWAGDAPARREWTVGEVKREAMVYAPAKAKTEATPLVLVFHGHGGTMRNTVRTFAIHQHWPQAIVVYPQGLNTPGRLTDPEGKKPGWQHSPGDQHCTLYPFTKGNPVMTYIHPGGHEFPRDAPAVMVKFFKQHARP